MSDWTQSKREAYQRKVRELMRERAILRQEADKEPIHINIDRTTPSGFTLVTGKQQRATLRGLFAATQKRIADSKEMEIPF